MLLITRYYPLLPVTPSYYMFYNEKDFTRLVSGLQKFLLHLRCCLLLVITPLIPVTPSYYIFIGKKILED